MTINGHHVLLDEGSDDDESRSASQPKLTEGENEAVKGYTGQWFHSMSDYARSGGKVPEYVGKKNVAGLKQKVADLQSAVDKSTLGKMTLYRAVDPSAFGVQPGTEDEFTTEPGTGLKQFTGLHDSSAAYDFSKTAGTTFTDNGFVSTTTSKSEAGEFDLMTIGKTTAVAQINIPDGTHGLVVTKDQTNYPIEREVILQRGLTYHVDSVEKVPVFASVRGLGQPSITIGNPGERGSRYRTVDLLHVSVAPSE